VDRAQELGERVSSAKREPGLERSSSFFHVGAGCIYVFTSVMRMPQLPSFRNVLPMFNSGVFFLHFRVAAICYNTRQWYIADSAPPGTPFTMDSYSLGACRRLDAITPVAATVSTCLHGPVCTNTCRHP